MNKARSAQTPTFEPPVTERLGQPGAMKYSLRRALLWLLLYIVLALVPMAIAITGDTPESRGFWIELGVAMGLSEKQPCRFADAAWMRRIRNGFQLAVRDTGITVKMRSLFEEGGVYDDMYDLVVGFKDNIYFRTCLPWPGSCHGGPC